MTEGELNPRQFWVIVLVAGIGLAASVCVFVGLLLLVGLTGHDLPR